MRRIDLTGQKFGMLTVLRQGEKILYGKQTKSTWVCKCDCGNEVVVPTHMLRRHEKYSCGCKISPRRYDKFKDLSGQKFGRLTVLECVSKENGVPKYRCKCDCGNEIIALGGNLTSGHTTSCGCYREQRRSESHTRHGQSKTRLYGVWGKIKDRCERKNCPSYKRYGAKGITLCEEWHDFEIFSKWAYEHGYDKNAEFGTCTLDRIDNEKGYSPDNCRWVDMKVQSNNRSSNHPITFNGETHNLTEWSRLLDIDQSYISTWLKKGKTFEWIVDYYKK